MLGAIILHAQDGWLDVVDGQQRLLTLRMVFAVLQSENLLPDGRGKDDPPVLQVWQTLRHRLASLKDAEKTRLHDFISTRCQLVRVVTDDVDEAFRVFDSQNYLSQQALPAIKSGVFHVPA